MKWILLFLFSTNTFAAGSKSVAIRLKSASQEYERENYTKVIELLNPYSEELPNPGLMILANSYSKEELYADEVRVLHVLAGKNENNYEAQMLLGQGLQKQALITKEAEAAKKIRLEAVQAFRTITKMRPKFKPAFDSLYFLLVQMNAATDARDTLVEGLEKFGHRPELMMEMCRLDSIEGYVSQALLSCREAIHLAPAYPDSYVYLSQSFFDQKENNSAERELVNAARRFPASEFVQSSAGTVFLKKKNYPVSARYFEQAVQAEPNSARAVFGYAQSLFESGKEKEALDYYKKACRMQPSAVVEPFFSASAKLRLKGNPLASAYKEGASACH